VSVHRIVEIHCDQNPLPNRCSEQLRIDVTLVDQPLNLEWYRIFAQKRDWGVVNVNGKDAHYCPAHRPPAP
jgi:hypothetical protein